MHFFPPPSLYLFRSGRQNRFVRGFPPFVGFPFPLFAHLGACHGFFVSPVQVFNPHQFDLLYLFPFFSRRPMSFSPIGVISSPPFPLFVWPTLRRCFILAPLLCAFSPCFVTLIMISYPSSMTVFGAVQPSFSLRPFSYLSHTPPPANIPPPVSL